KSRVVLEAEGEARRFLSIYEEYARAPEVTKRRLYLETMESVLSRSNKVILDQNGSSQGVVPYLPLSELRSRMQRGQQQQQGGNQCCRAVFPSPRSSRQSCCSSPGRRSTSSTRASRRSSCASARSSTSRPNPASTSSCLSRSWKPTTCS